MMYWIKRMVLTGAAVMVTMSLAACGDAQQKEAQQTQQEPNQQAAPSSSSPAQSSNLLAGRGLIGTWELTHINGQPVDPGTGTQTFSEDATLQSTSSLWQELGVDIPTV
ncbi:MAG: hypothetical protein LC674_08250, partial [Actinobacteria bacterium]|nr:hypothetical protein [Actinomycetota bacterium]